MPRRRAMVQRGPVRSVRAPTNWSGFSDVAMTTVSAGTKSLLGTFALDNPGIGETVRRTRGVITISSDQEAGAELQIGAFGLVVVNDLALAAGAASIPGPITNDDDDGWFVWVPFARASSAADGFDSQSFQFDSKAMRRVAEGFGLAVMVENAHASQGLRISVNFRLLSSLS